MAILEVEAIGGAENLSFWTQVQKFSKIFFFGDFGDNTLWMVLLLGIQQPIFNSWRSQKLLSWWVWDIFMAEDKVYNEYQCQSNPFSTGKWQARITIRVSFTLPVRKCDRVSFDINLNSKSHFETFWYEQHGWNSMEIALSGIRHWHLLIQILWVEIFEKYLLCSISYLPSSVCRKYCTNKNRQLNWNNANFLRLGTKHFGCVNLHNWVMNAETANT